MMLTKHRKQINMNEENKLNTTPAVDDRPASCCYAWKGIDSCPPFQTVIIGGRNRTGSGYCNKHGNWFVYGTSIPMEAPTHWMPYPDAPNS